MLPRSERRSDVTGQISKCRIILGGNLFTNAITELLYYLLPWGAAPEITTVLFCFCTVLFKARSRASPYAQRPFDHEAENSLARRSAGSERCLARKLPALERWHDAYYLRGALLRPNSSVHSVRLSQRLLGTVREGSGSPRGRRHQRVLSRPCVAQLAAGRDSPGWHRRGHLPSSETN